MVKDVEVVITKRVRVTLDESKFDQTFLAEFRESFYPFRTLNEHIEHLAQLEARELVSDGFDEYEFIEGYGPRSEMGIELKTIDVDVEMRVL